MISERTPPTPTVISCSRLDLSNYSCAPNLEICAASGHQRGCPDSSDTSVFAVSTVSSTGRYKPVRSEPSWELL
ncbi:hypothetical protein J6590_059873 [Homalodisca vitripennis]|nr:hypothetical protein J6590_059873 [Homalodisca vitripennis]